jgi:hypothetical protein
MDPTQYPNAYPVGQPIPMPGQPAGAAQPMGMNGQMPPGGGGQISPEVVQAILALQQQPQQQAAIDRQMKQAQAMRGQFAPDSPTGVMGARGGSLAVGAPNYLGAIGQVLSAYKAGKLEDDADVRSKNLGVQKTDAMRRYFESLTNQRGPGVGFMGDEGE